MVFLVRAELQLQYTNFKNTLQQLAQKIGDMEQEGEEHKSVDPLSCLLWHDELRSLEDVVTHVFVKLAD